MKIIDPKTTPAQDLYQYLIGVVGPRPIALASTMDREGRPNLAPYSFFNIFSYNPPVAVFSSIRRMKDQSAKDTLRNIEETGEVVINIVTFPIVRQMVLTSVEFPTGIKEFEMAGFTPIPADMIRPFRIKESPVHLECRLRQIVPLGHEGGAGSLIICEIVRLHLANNIIDERGRINPHQLDLMGRLGRAYYVRASGEAVHTVLQDRNEIPIGFNNLPPTARNSAILTGNNLGQLAGISVMPRRETVEELRQEERIQAILSNNNPLEELHRYAQKELAKDNRELAATIVWLGEAMFG